MELNTYKIKTKDRTIKMSDRQTDIQITIWKHLFLPIWQAYKSCHQEMTQTYADRLHKAYPAIPKEAVRTYLYHFQKENTKDKKRENDGKNGKGKKTPKNTPTPTNH